MRGQTQLHFAISAALCCLLQAGTRRCKVWRRASQKHVLRDFFSPAGNLRLRKGSDFLQATQQISRTGAAGWCPEQHGVTRELARKAASQPPLDLLSQKPRAGLSAQPLRNPSRGFACTPGETLCHLFGKRSPEEEQTLISYCVSLKLK